MYDRETPEGEQGMQQTQQKNTHTPEHLKKKRYKKAAR